MDVSNFLCCTPWEQRSSVFAVMAGWCPVGFQEAQHGVSQITKYAVKEAVYSLI